MSRKDDLSISSKTDGESFRAFKDSFSYGSRTDLNFKFLKGLSTEDAALFFQELLAKLGNALDDGDFARLVNHVAEWQERAYSRETPYTYSDGPFAVPAKPISESRVVLITSSGHFLEDRDPRPFGVEAMTQKEAVDRIGDFLKEKPELATIPKDTPRERLRVRHGGYDVSGAQVDPNSVFPLEILREFERSEVIGELASEHYSFVGATSQKRLMKEVGPQWTRMLKEQEIDVALLVPV